MERYKNYRELKEAYDNGELSRTLHPLILDNDTCTVYVEDECVFRGNGYEDLLGLAIMAGFPAEWC